MCKQAVHPSWSCSRDRGGNASVRRVVGAPQATVHFRCRARTFNTEENGGGILGVRITSLRARTLILCNILLTAPFVIQYKLCSSEWHPNLISHHVHGRHQTFSPLSVERQHSAQYKYLDISDKSRVLTWCCPSALHLWCGSG